LDLTATPVLAHSAYEHEPQRVGGNPMNLKQVLTAIGTLLAGVALMAASGGIASAKQLRWKRVIGIQQTSDLVGSGNGAVTCGAPWETTRGSVDVNLNNDNVTFDVKGLILAVGSVPSLPLTGLAIGTTGGVTEVKGTLVCNVDGKNGGADSLLFDTPSTALDAQGNAHFNGSFSSSLPTVCGSQNDDAFLIRIVQPAGFADIWIAFGAIPTL
jgi:hypothetical protein